MSLFGATFRRVAIQGSRRSGMKRWFQRARDAILVAIALLAALPAHAQLTIEIIGGGATQTPIAIVPFAGEAAYPLGITGVVGADLQRSGLFKLVDAGVAARPANPLDVRYPEFRARGAEAIVVGSMMQTAPGLVNVRFFLLDAVKQTQITAFSYNVAPGQFRAVAHKIADVIYEAMTGDKGVFSTRIAYIVKQGRRHMLQVADADGYNPQTIVNSDEPLLSPAWSPDGTRIAFVSFENRKPVVYVQVARERPASRCWRTSRQQQLGARVVAGQPEAGRHADQGRQLADVPDQRRRQRGAAHRDQQRHRHRGEFRARRRVAAVRLRPRRVAADLPLHARDRRGRARELRRQLQHDAAPRARRQELRFPQARWQPFQHRGAGHREPPGASPHAGRQRREPQFRAQWPDDPLRIRPGGAWYIGRRFQRRSCESSNVCRPPSAATSASPLGARSENRRPQ